MTHVNLTDVQGNLLRGYGSKKRFVRHLIVKVKRPSAAREFLRDSIGGTGEVPQITTANTWTDRPETCWNVGVSAAGLSALGVDRKSVDSFPQEFRDGAVGRAGKVGDVEASDPGNWRDGLGDPDAAHLMWTIFADTAEARDDLSARVEATWRRAGSFSVTTRLDGEGLDDDKVHFGYRDSISQPRFDVNGLPAGRADAQPLAPVGALLLGPYETPFPDISWQIPEPAQLAVNGCFNAFRVLEQDVAGFQQFLECSAEQLMREFPDHLRADVDPVEFIAAKLMGRWRNGVPLSLSHLRSAGRHQHAQGQSHYVNGMPEVGDDDDLNDFDYPDQWDSRLDDFNGTMCPVGAHIRRANPRGSRIVQRSANHTRPIVRRGVPYGSPFNPAHPADGIRRGLLGSFLCADLAAQYEAVMYDWINLGLQDPRVTGTNDVIIGANHERTSRYEIQLDADHTLVLRGFPRFTQTVGSVYLFCPSISALRLISARS